MNYNKNKVSEKLLQNEIKERIQKKENLNKKNKLCKDVVV